MRNCAYTKYTKFHVATAEHRITDTEKVLKDTCTKNWDLVGIEPTLFGRVKVQPHYAFLSHLPSTPTLVPSLLEVAAEWREKSWLDS